MAAYYEMRDGDTFQIASGCLFVIAPNGETRLSLDFDQNFSLLLRAVLEEYEGEDFESGDIAEVVVP
jgi:hypothetical protein